MDDMINRHDSIAEENIEPNGRPAKDQFEEWSGEVADRADDARAVDVRADQDARMRVDVDAEVIDADDAAEDGTEG